MSLLKFGKCDYCGECTEVRPTPYLADIGAEMCESCWEFTRKIGLYSEGIDIGVFRKKIDTHVVHKTNLAKEENR